MVDTAVNLSKLKDFRVFYVGVDGNVHTMITPNYEVTKHQAEQFMREDTAYRIFVQVKPGDTRCIAENVPERIDYLMKHHQFVYFPEEG